VKVTCFIFEFRRSDADEERVRRQSNSEDFM
jgi:hypothetical protein